MSQTAAFARVLADPLSNGARLAFAEAVAADDPARAEVIRLQVASLRADRGEGPALPADAILRLNQLIWQHQARWAPRLPGVELISFERGFAEGVRCTAAGFLDLSATLFEAAPIVHAYLEEVIHATDLLSSEPLARLLSLDLRGNRLTDAEAIALSASPHLHQLVWLDLSTNRIGKAGLRAITRSSNLAALQWLGFRFNATPDPTPQVGDDYRGAVYVAHTAAGSELIDQVGPRAFLEHPRFEHPHPPPAWFYPLTDE